MELTEHIREAGTMKREETAVEKGTEGGLLPLAVFLDYLSETNPACLSTALFQQSQTLSLCPHYLAQGSTCDGSTHSLICCLFRSVFQPLEPPVILRLSHSGLHLDAIH